MPGHPPGGSRASALRRGGLPEGVERLGHLGRELEAFADRLGGAEIEDEGEDLHQHRTMGLTRLD